MIYEKTAAEDLMIEGTTAVLIRTRLTETI